VGGLHLINLLAFKAQFTTFFVDIEFAYLLIFHYNINIQHSIS